MGHCYNSDLQYRLQSRLRQAIHQRSVRAGRMLELFSGLPDMRPFNRPML
jgi:hypothetical protein